MSERDFLIVQNLETLAPPQDLAFGLSAVAEGRRRRKFANGSKKSEENHVNIHQRQ